MLTVIATQTNIYAAKSMEGMPPTPHARANAWKDVSVEEIRDFFGLFFLTGLVKKTELAEYWSTDEALSTPYFAKVREAVDCVVSCMLVSQQL